MSESPHVRLRKPNRLQTPHSGQQLEPPMTRKGVFAHPGSLLIGFSGFAFFAYAFDVGGLKGWVDGVLHGVDAGVRSHNGEVASWFVKAVPYFAVVGGTIASVFMLTLVVTLTKSLGASALKSKPKKKKKAQEAGAVPATPAKVETVPVTMAAKPAPKAVAEPAPVPKVTAAPASPAPVAQPSPAPLAQPSPARAEFIRPARLAVREADLKVKPKTPAPAPQDGR